MMKTLMDKEELRSLSAAFAALQEKGACTKEAVRKVFAEEGSVEYPTGNAGTGMEAVMKAHEEVNRAFLSVLANVSNEQITLTGEDTADLKFHMTVLHKFAPEIAVKLPGDGDLFIAYDKVDAKAVKEQEGWRFQSVKISDGYKMLVREMEQI